MSKAGELSKLHEVAQASCHPLLFSLHPLLRAPSAHIYGPLGIPYDQLTGEKSRLWIMGVPACYVCGN